MPQEEPALPDPPPTSPGTKEPSENTAGLTERNSEKELADNNDATLLPNGIIQQEDDPEGGALGIRAIVGAWGV